jgi:hypothetical protein
MVLPDRHNELQDFKTQIDLCDFACAWGGFSKDRRQSSRSSAVLKHTNGDKLVVARTSTKQHIYFNVHDPRDRGTIIDFVQHREKLTLGEIRKLLRGYLGRPISLPAGETPTALSLVPSQFDIASVHAAWMRASPLPAHYLYLEHERQISRKILEDPKFKDRIRIDKRNNAIFPHYNHEGLCGFEVKNSNWTGFSPGGLKGCWRSRPHPDDQMLLIFETAIDALSLASLTGTQGRQFFSTAGQMSSLQMELLRDSVARLPAESQVLLCMDNDEGGDKMTSTIIEQLAPYSRLLLEFRPPIRGQDWNDVLRSLRDSPLTAIPQM